MKKKYLIIAGFLSAAAFGFYLYQKNKSDFSPDELNFDSAANAIGKINKANGKPVDINRVKAELGKLYDSYTMIQRDILSKMLSLYETIAKESTKPTPQEIFTRLTASFEVLKGKYTKEQLDIAAKKVMADLEKLNQSA